MQTVEKYQGLIQSTGKIQPPKPQTTVTGWDYEIVVTEITICYFPQIFKTKYLVSVLTSFSFILLKKNSVFHSADAAITNCHKLTGLNKKHSFFSFGSWEGQDQDFDRFGFYKNPLRRFQIAIFPYPTWQRAHRVTIDHLSFLKVSLNLYMRVPSSWSNYLLKVITLKHYFQTLPYWGLGFNIRIDTKIQFITYWKTLLQMKINKTDVVSKVQGAFYWPCYKRIKQILRQRIWMED